MKDLQKMLSEKSFVIVDTLNKMHPQLSKAYDKLTMGAYNSILHNIYNEVLEGTPIEDLIDETEYLIEFLGENHSKTK
jgi:hypothetical protein